MKKKILKISLEIFLVFAFLLSYNFGQAAGFLDGNLSDSIEGKTDQIQIAAGYNPGIELGDAVAIAIKGFLSLLGVIFVILIIISGYNWMTASGDEEKIKKATSTIRSAIIGLLIVVAAYSITYFVFANLSDVSSL
jgi:cytochrome bd-type quinol oxidase subunit 2